MADNSRRPRKALTALAVRSARPGKHYDGNGLFLRVEASGGRRWVQRIVIQGRTRELGLGSADLVTLAEAREFALANRRAARAGGDPLTAKRETDAVMTFEEAAHAVHKAHLPTWRNPKHGDQWISSLKTYAFPHFGKTKVSEVSSADVLTALTPIWTKMPETATRVQQRIRTVMDWVIAKGWRKDNPAQAIRQALPKAGKTQKQHRKALPYTEVADCLEAVRASRAAIATKLALEFLVLTAARSSEVRLAHASEVDLKAAVWTVPGIRMKAGKTHRVPLSPRAVEIVREAMNLDDGSGLVFPGARRGRPLSDVTMLKLIRENGYPVDVHGFRASFKTWAMEATGFPREVAEFALAHVTRDAAERAYERSDLFEKRRKLMLAWSAYLASPKAASVRLTHG